MNIYPLAISENDILPVVKEIVRQRNTEDVQDFDNLNNIFIRGRKVGKVPTSSADVTSTDREGDFNYDASYIYVLIDNSGLVWRRATLGSW